MCAVSKLIVKVFPSTAKVHDANAKVLEQYLPWAKHCGKSVLFFADAGYKGKEIEDKLLNAGLPPLERQEGSPSDGQTEKEQQTDLDDTQPY